MSGWLVSARFDLLAFGAPAVVGLALVPLGPVFAPSGDTPWPMWLLAVLAVDVAHVWATLYRTYLDPRAVARHRTLLIAAPVLCFLGAWGLAAASLLWFWRVLAYVAVFHFVRQQEGWLAIYQRKDDGLHEFERFFERWTIRLSAVYPLVWWHAHLPRDFEWFVPGDFVVGLPGWVEQAMFPLYLVLLGVFVVRQVFLLATGRGRPGKLLLVVSTAACWGVGIVATNTDWAFTVTNVLIHGVPYMAYVWVVTRREEPPARTLLAWIMRHGALFYAVLLGLASLEELGWRWSEAYGSAALVAVLTVPQATHYVLDGFIWRRRPRFGKGRALTPAES